MTDHKNTHTGARRALDNAEDAVGAAVGAASAAMSGNSTSGFVKNAMLGDLYEIQAAELALSRAAPRLQSLAREMLSDHRQNSQRLISTVKSAKTDIDIPADLDERRRGLIDNLRTAPPEEFEDSFIRQQQAVHEEAVQLYRNYCENGESEALRSFAGTALPVLERHLEHVQGLSAGR